MQGYAWMLLPVVMPVPVWAALLVGAALLLIGTRPKPPTSISLLPFVLPVALAQSGVAAAGLFLTLRGPIDTEACLTGIFGYWAGVSLATLWIALFLIPLAVSQKARVALSGHKGFLIALAFSTTLSTLAHLRSALLCTV